MLPFKLIYDDGYDLNLGDHVFPSKKFGMIRDRLLAEGIAEGSDYLAPEPATDEDMLRAHSLNWITRLKAGTLDYLELNKLEIPYSRRMVDAFWLATGGTILAARRALRDGIGFNLGGGFHHAYPNHGEGFCAVNDIAVAIRKMQAERLIERAMVIDTDVHHGNGTAAIFAGDASVFTLSIHQLDNYPAHKPESTIDINLPDGVGDEEYLEKLREASGKGLAEFTPQLVIYVAGADPYREDKLGGLNLTMEGLKARDRLVFDLARKNGVAVAVVLAGGYAHKVEDTVTIHCNTVRAAVEAVKAADERLSHEIRRVFPSQPFDGPVTDCDCEECIDIRETLKHRSWREVPVSFLDFTRGPTLLSKEAFVYFLPAYMVRALEDLRENPEDPTTLHFTLCSLVLDDPLREPHRHRKRVALMNPDQITVVRLFLRYVCSSLGEGQEHYQRDIRRALETMWIPSSEPGMGN